MIPLRMRRSLGGVARRKFLRGAGAIAVGLPFLEGASARQAQAATSPARRFICFFQPCGIDVNTFWPTAYGPLTDATMPDDRGIGPLRAWKSRLLIPRGIHSVPRGHSREGIAHNEHSLASQCRLTASTHPNATKCSHPSVDSVIAAQKNPPGRPPLVLAVGRNTGAFPGGTLSYDESGNNRPRISNPKISYEKLVGLSTGDPSASDKILKRRMSVLDAVKSDFDELKSDKALSAADRRMLDMHFSGIKELETGIAATCRLSKELTADLGGVVPARVYDDALFQQVGKLQTAILALAIGCDYTRAALLMWGNIANGPVHSWLGHTHEHHLISHRVVSYSGGGVLNGATKMLNQIDRWHAARLADLLALLDAYQEADGTALDNTVVAWVNELSEGKMHHYRDMPVVLAGGCGGYFKSGGHYIKVTKFDDPLANSDKARVEDAPHNKLLTMIANACGVRQPNGSPLENFGKAGKTGLPGEFTELKK